ncbi:MAG: methenyltetrahydromethanopterin cyclohydrolase, partial [Bacillota bacterium]
NIYLLVAPSASLVGSIQVAARSVEQTVHKMYEHDFDLDNICFARGLAPAAPVINDEVEAMGRINDALLYGGLSEFWVECSDKEIESVIDSLVSLTSESCGQPFAKLFVEAEHDFFKMDKDIHAMARVKMHNLKTGNMFTAGKIHQDIIKKSYTGRVIK